MKRSFSRAVAGLAALSFMTGCGLDQYPSYSASVKYGIRTDPLVRGSNAKDLGAERYDPDPPGVLPIMNISDISRPESPYFANRAKLDDKVLRDPTLLSEKDRAELHEALEAMFGTPARPTVNAQLAGLESAVITELKLDDDTLAKGSTRYRIHCLHCHGVAGDGRGPTARWINPHPRDFRAMLFKFQSVDQTRGQTDLPPSRADLMRTLRQGIEGTAMPSFNLLQDEELEWMVSYVIHLSLRGKVEATTIMESFEYDSNGPKLTWRSDEEIKTPKDAVKAYANLFANKWRESNLPGAAIVPAKYPYDPNDMETLKKSVKRGQEIFNAKPSPEFLEEFKKVEMDRAVAAAKKAAEGDKKALSPKDLEAVKKGVEATFEAKVGSVLKAANCVSCHTDYGRQARFRFDEWGTLVRPNNLPQGYLRGGKRPVDIYYRVHSGINGSGMTNFGKTFRDHPDYLWDLVNFVQNVPYPGMREKLGIKLD